MALPKQLATHVVGGRTLVEVKLDLTVYLDPIGVAELDYLVGWYRALCPADRFVHYTIAELTHWDSVRSPYLTRQGIEAEQRGEPLPFLAPVRSRISMGRPFELQFWDGVSEGTWTFSLRAIRLESRELATFVRISLPHDVDPALLFAAAAQLSDNVPLRSGHAGYSFGYDPDRKFDAFTYIYPLARRFWGVDVEDLNGTLPNVGFNLKTAAWLTLVSDSLAGHEAVVSATELCDQEPALEVHRLRRALLFRAAAVPPLGDRNRPTGDLDGVMALARAFAPITMDSHPGFSGDGFIDNADTDAWLQRLWNPTGWP